MIKPKRTIATTTKRSKRSTPWPEDGHDEAEDEEASWLDDLELRNQFFKVVTTLFVIPKHIIASTARRQEDNIPAS